MPAAKDSSLPLVITMWETYGSNMEAVAKRVGELLGIPVYPQGLSSAEIEELAAEDRTGRAAEFARRLALGKEATGVMTAEDEEAFRELARKNTEVVRARAEGGGVIQGRNGAFILRDRPNTLHVKLDGIAEKRIERAARLDDITLERSAARQAIEDDVRVETSLQAFQWDPRDIESYDAILNTSFQDTEETAQFIVAMAKVKAGLA